MLAEANTAFAFNLYRQLVEENGTDNVLLSPFSVTVAFGMALEGARGKTAEEIAQTLEIPESHRALFGRSLSGLLQIINAAQNDPALAEKRAQIAALRQELQDLEPKHHNDDEIWVDGSDPDEERVVGKLNRLLAQVDQFELSIANALFGEQGYPFKQDFLDTLKSLYGANGGLIPCDFRNNHETERGRINQWASDQTKGKISNPLSEDSVGPDTALVLINAIYFKGEWEKPFKESKTEPGSFFCLSGQRADTPLMHDPYLAVGSYGAFNADGSFFETPHVVDSRVDDFQTTTFDSARSEVEFPSDGAFGYPGPGGVQVLELPYKGNEISMVALLARGTENLTRLEKKLTPALIGSYLDQLDRRPVSVTLPKFKLKTDYQLNEPLTRLGMVNAFKNPILGQGADFSGMAEMSDALDPLFISMVIHQAMIDVNEKGTEAAAVTAMVMTVGSAMEEEIPFIPEFRANRPFIHLIVHRKTKTILFLGRMTKPPG